MDQPLKPSDFTLWELMQPYMGWIIALLLSIWGAVLRLILGRHLRASDRIEAKIDELVTDVNHIKGFLQGRDDYEPPNR